ncbi:Uncharacterized protein HZ326_20796 [Fusarium oxysporum f. sp. albedinis]|nr:Uncharacterized protein HZ326_20796 [Fusarium oxysporum f. sp. albedinis]
MCLGQFRDPPDCTLTKACRGDGVGCADDSRVPLAGFTSNRMGNSTQGSLWKFSGGLPREDEESGGLSLSVQAYKASSTFSSNACPSHHPRRSWILHSICHPPEQTLIIATVLT